MTRRGKLPLNERVPPKLVLEVCKGSGLSVPRVLDALLARYDCIEATHKAVAQQVKLLAGESLLECQPNKARRGKDLDDMYALMHKGAAALGFAFQG